jgi:hypothetical protein
VPVDTTPSPCFTFRLSSRRGVLIEFWGVGDEISVHSGESAAAVASAPRLHQRRRVEARDWGKPR